MTEPFDLFDFICDLDERIERLALAGYVDEAEALRAISLQLKRLRLAAVEGVSRP